MTTWNEYEYEMGLSHMISGILSETEIYKLMGMFQWTSIGRLIERPVNRIADAHGDRLYPSFVCVEATFPTATAGRFDEGTRVHVRHGLNVYGRRFVEGFAIFDASPIPASVTENISTRGQLEALPYPWVYMTNAFVARTGGNSRLKVFEPVGMEGARAAETAVLPEGIAEHRKVVATGRLPSIGDEPAVELPVRSKEPIRYPIVLESDINAAGLLYFARYSAIANYVERLHLAERLVSPISFQLTAALSAERRRIYYFGNAEPFDAIEGVASVRVLARPSDAAPRSSPFTLLSRVDLRRASDHVLIASTVSRKTLLGSSDRALVSEVDRLRESLS